MISFLGIFRKEIIGPADDPYLVRYNLTPWKWWPFRQGVYVHVFYRPDAEPWLHDHPRHLSSRVLRGGYVEERGSLRLMQAADGSVALPPRFCLTKWQVERRKGDRIELSLDTKHRIIRLLAVPTVTLLIITRAKERSWGFWVEAPDGEVKFVNSALYFGE